MNLKKRNNQVQVLIRQLSAGKKRIRKSSMKEGANLANSVTEDIRGESLKPHYSKSSRNTFRVASRDNKNKSRVAKSVWGDMN